MRREPSDALRAIRLLRWYPTAWRKRYGDEFIDHLEQEFSDRPVDLRRTLNIAYKGLVARVSDVGLSNSTAGVEERTRSAIGTSFVLTALMMIVALNYWSRAVSVWGSRRYHPLPISATTGILTVTTGLLVAMLVATVLTVALSVVRQIARGRARPLAVPSIVALGSGGLLAYSVRWLSSQLVLYVRGAHGIPGIRLSDPGRFVEAIAQITWGLTFRWIDLWDQAAFRTPRMQTVMNDLVPVAVLTFGIAIALLVRRVESPNLGERLGHMTVIMFSTLATAFTVTYFIWLMVGGQSGYGTQFPAGEHWISVAYLVLLALIAALVGRSGILARRMRT